MSAHAINPPSGAHGWIACPGWAGGGAGSHNEYSAEGTAAHFLASTCLQLHVEPAAFAGKDIVLWKHPESDSEGVAFADESLDPALVITFTFPVNDEMVEAIGRYVGLVRTLAAGALDVGIERRVDMTPAVPDCWGTSDTVIVHPGRITTIDLKYGRGIRVHAERNPQLMLYAFGALREYELLHDIGHITVIVAQPRLDHIDEWTCSVAELRAFAHEAGVAATRRSSLDLGALVPGEEQCRWCANAPTCPALARHVAETVGADFEDLTAPRVADAQRVAQLTPVQLHVAMTAVPLVEDWCRLVRAEVERRLLAGVDVPGFKLVQGRQDNPRAWIDPKQAEAKLKSMRLSLEEMYDRKLINPTSAEKLHKAGRLGDRQWSALQKLITRSEGGLSVAPIDDRRLAAKPLVSVDDFEELPAPAAATAPAAPAPTQEDVSDLV